MSYSNRETVGLRRVQWLIEQMLAKQDSLTDEQLERFARNPEVCIPDGAMELNHLPKMFINPHGFRLTSENHLLYQAECDGNRFFVEDRGNRYGANTWSRSGMRIVTPLDLGVKKLFGWVNDEPLWLDTHRYCTADFDMAPNAWDLEQPKGQLVLGLSTIYEGFGLNVVGIQTDGTVFFTETERSEWTWSLKKWRDDQVEVEWSAFSGNELVKFLRRVEDGEDRDYCVFRLQGTEERHYADVGYPGKNISQVCPVVDLVETENGLVVVEGNSSQTKFCVSLSDRYANPDQPRKSETDKCLSIRGTSYLRDGRQLPNGEFVYVSAARHGQERLVATNGATWGYSDKRDATAWQSPAFNWVSQVFMHPEMRRWCYYGIIGRNVLTMRLPEHLLRKIDC